MAKVRAGVVVSGQFRRLLSLAENAKGEIVIGIQSAENYLYDPDGTKILQQKYTVHASLDSKTYNTVTHTLVLGDGRRLRSYSVTDAIKSENGFAFLFARRCPDLSKERYLLKNSKKFTPVILGDYDSRIATPVFAVFVGSINTRFRLDYAPELAVTEIPFAKFKLIIVHGLLRMPSHRTGDLVHGMTIKPESAPPAYQEMLWALMKGRDENRCLSNARAIFKRMIAKHARYVLQNEKLDNLSASYLVDLLRFIGEPVTDERERPEEILALGRPPSARWLRLWSAH